MSAIQPQQAPERRPAPVPPINAPTNNPFRKGAGSPALSPPMRSDSPVKGGPTRNPFLDNPFETAGAQSSSVSPPKAVSNRLMTSPRENEPLISGLTLEDKPRSKHHISQSQNSNRDDTKQPPRAETLDIFADPPIQRTSERRLRRNSESSIAEHKLTDEEKKKRDRERRHREHRSKDSSGRPIPSSASKNKKPSRRLDVIDKLDVTSIYGTGLFHHDGPFDAVASHRNRKGSNRAPMNAFAKDSKNNVMGGSGPLNNYIDLDRFHGHQEDSFKDFNSARVVQQPEPQYEHYIGPGVRPRGSSKSGPNYDRTSSFNPGAKVDPVHGEESLGLGTSTFFEGTPAGRVAIQRRESESDATGLTRKKSIAQKIRGISNGRPKRYDNGEAASPEAQYERTASPDITSAGGAVGKPKLTERNPFFQDYDREYEKKGAHIRIAEEQNTTGGESSRVAPAQLTRSITEGGVAGDRLAVGGESKSSGGFLSRVKSLRGGGRGKRPDRPA